MSVSAYQQLLNRLDGFINKHYTNLVIRGIIYVLLSLSAVFILFNALENWLYFSPRLRTILFYAFCVLAVFMLVYFVLVPALKRWHILARMSYLSAAESIGRHFPDINDKITNILQLHSMEGVSPQQLALIEAGIQQKYIEIKPFPFLQGISFAKNKRYAAFLLLPGLLIGLTYLFYPSWVKAPTERLWNHNKTYERPAPYAIKLLSLPLQAFSKGSFSLRIAVEGKLLPQHLYVHYNGHSFLMQQGKGNTFSYTFSYLHKSLDFNISDKHRFASQNYHLKVINKALLAALRLQVSPPAHTGIAPYILSDFHQLRLPYASKLQLRAQVSHCDTITLIKNDIALPVLYADSHYIFSDTLKQNTNYRLYAGNAMAGISDSATFDMMVIPDQYPSIEVQSVQDSTETALYFFAGSVQDDYGLRRVRMHLQYRDSSGYIPIPLASKARLQSFVFHYKFHELPLRVGEACTYYFSVQDNDAVHGYKTSKTPTFSYRRAALAQQIADKNAATDSIAQGMRKDLNQLKQLQKAIEKLRKELLGKELMSWNDKEKMKALLDEHKQIEQHLKKMQQASTETFSLSDSMAASIEQKEEELRQMMEEVLSPELKQKIEEFSKKMEEWNKEQSMDMLKDMEQGFEDYEKALDRQMELFKRMEIENKLQAHIEQLQQMSAEQAALAKQKAKNAQQQEALKQQQAQLKADYESIRKDMQSLDSLNKALEAPMPMDMQQSLQDSLQQSLQQAMEKMSRQPQHAAPHQKKASQQMQSLADAMQMQFSNSAMQQAAEDAEMLRNILQQLLRLSFHQEHLLDSLRALPDADPAYNTLMSEQFYAQKHFATVRDSLEALSRRQKAVKPFVIRQLGDIDNRTESLLEYMASHNVYKSLREQQYIMQAYNNLALMLHEALQDIEKQMNSMMSSASCPNGGKGKRPGNKPKLGQAQQLQQQLNQQMKAMQKGQRPGGKAAGQQGSSEQFARMAAKQAQIRRMLQDYKEEMMQAGGSKPGGLDDAIRDMQKTERDLVNKILNRQTIARQAQIQTRLLRAEKAEQEREQSKKRKSEAAKQLLRKRPPSIKAYERIKQKEEALLQTLPLQFSPYYKQQSERYFMQINRQIRAKDTKPHSN